MIPPTLHTLLLGALTWAAMTAAQITRRSSSLDGPLQEPRRGPLSGPSDSSCPYQGAIASADRISSFTFPGVNRTDEGIKLVDTAQTQWRLYQTVTYDNETRRTVGEGYINVPGDQAPSDDLPYQACAQIWQVPASIAGALPTVGGSCRELFGQDCYRGLEAIYQEELAAVRDTDEDTPDRCRSLFDRVARRELPNLCVTPLDPLRNRQTIVTDISVDNTTQGCPDSVSSYNFDTQTFSPTEAEAEAAAPRDASNQTAVSNAWESVTAYVIARVNRERVDGDPFGNVQFICARPVTNGSWDGYAQGGASGLDVRYGWVMTIVVVMAAFMML